MTGKLPAANVPPIDPEEAIQERGDWFTDAFMWLVTLPFYRRGQRGGQERREFVNRHRAPALPLPWLTFVIGFAIGVLVVVLGGAR